MIAHANKSDRGRIFLFFKNRDFDLNLEKMYSLSMANRKTGQSFYYPWFEL